jgi:hypothetical protein
MSAQVEAVVHALAHETAAKEAAATCILALLDVADYIPGGHAPMWYLDGPADEVPELNDPAAIRKEANALIEEMRDRARAGLAEAIRLLGWKCDVKH